MTAFVIPAPQQPSLPVQGSDARFPVRRIYCVGRNYAEHAREFGNDPDREPPFFFAKPGDALVGDDLVLTMPSRSDDLHHEVELVVALGAGGRDIAVAEAASKIWGFGIGIDLTLRDVQAQAKEMRRPWDISKGFDGSAVCGPLHPAQGPLTQGAITLSVNGVLRQEGDLSQMIWPIADQIAELSSWITLQPGDLIFTGTPAGVGRLVQGDRVTATVEGLGEIALTIA